MERSRRESESEADNASITTSEKDDSTNAWLMSELTQSSVMNTTHQWLFLVTSLENTVEVWYKKLLNWDYDYCWFAFDGETLVGWVECHSVMDNAGG